MTERPLSLAVMESAFQALDKKLGGPLTLIMGGGGAMIMAHGYPLATTDVDAIPKGLEIYEIADLSKQIATELQLPADWLNCYFSTFAFVILPDFSENLITVFSGQYLQVKALSKEDMLIMKCFAHRIKDIGHAKALLKSGVNVAKVEAHIESLKAKKFAEAQNALDFLDDLRDQLE